MIIDWRNDNSVMSTSCHIIIVDDNNRRHYIYRDKQGYPSGVGSELQDILETCPSYDWETIMEKILGHNKQYEEDMGTTGYEEYIYMIYANNTESQLRCFKSNSSRLEELLFIETYPKNMDRQVCDKLYDRLDRYRTVSEKIAFIDGWSWNNSNFSENVIKRILDKALNTVPDLSGDLDEWSKYIKEKLDNGG